MIKDLFGGKEPAKERATRIWRNNDLTHRFKKMKETGKGSEEFSFYDGKKPFANEVPKPPNEPIRPADVIENNDPRVDRFERKFKKDIRMMLNGHKEENRALLIAGMRAAIYQEKRKLLLEKLRRLEASIAQREGAKS